MAAAESVSQEKTPATAGQDESSQENLPPPPTFGKTSLFILVIALAVYAYQTNVFSIWSGVVRDSHTGVESPATKPYQPYLSTDIAKRDEIVEAFKYAWGAYERDAMGDDEYKPLTKSGSNLTEAGGIGFTIIDSLDTMQIMGLEDEYKRAREWIAMNMTFDKDGHFNTFETTIRILGGLLSAYHLSDEDAMYLEKAIDLADRILPAFDTPSGLPRSQINLQDRTGIDDPNVPGLVSTAEASTLQLELKYLSFLTDNDEYWEKAEKVMKTIKDERISGPLVPIYMNAQTGEFMLSEIRLGSRGDSYYEYLLKQYLQTNRSEEVYREMYTETMAAIHDALIKRGLIQGHTYTAELVPIRKDGQSAWRHSHKQDHLVCFLGGSLMLGAITTGATGPVSVPPKPSELSEAAQKDWLLGSELIETCMDTYTSSATGLSPEIAHFWTENHGKLLERQKRDWYVKGNDFPGQPSYDARYILRPETIESLFIAYRLTGDDKYREYGWNIFQAIQKYCRVESGGYASLLNVENVRSIKMDKMETFFLSETLKYLYLLFSDETVIPLDKYVFNTEAHPLPIFTPSVRTGTF
ncbi:glycoside hydrolase family 47 protein [Pholiota conissans]|uniref:alpha-1,2-Mannosidase n=1 Tax=Pholiota conissans TaxID=109636 RepID=A0A9P5Z5X1_9AGAR|nr:glycoside hydrolase family 47 protein [Pholiota conissans]